VLSDKNITDGANPADDGGAPGFRSGRMDGDLAGAGPGGTCVCPDCGRETPHRAGVPCNTVACPWCGTRMTRA